jgi:enoyl-CoA hydratase/carnithine racemase
VALVLQSVDSHGVATLTLNDEANLNAMSDEMAQEFSAAVNALKGNKSLRAVILTGAGKAFSAGGHLSMLEAKREKSAEENRIGMLEFYNSFLCMRDLNVPLIAAINGTAVGAGLCVACACDFRVASDSTKLGFTFLKLGLHPGMGATYFVPRIVGASVATELLVTGRVINADDALRIGIVSRVVPSADVVKTARAIADEILTCGPLATAQLLQTMRGDPGELKSALEREALCQSVNYAGAEFAEGVCAVKEKRSPSFAKC